MKEDLSEEEVIANAEHKHSTRPTALTSGFSCRMSEHFKILLAFDEYRFWQFLCSEVWYRIMVIYLHFVVLSTKTVDCHGNRNKEKINKVKNVCYTVKTGPLTRPPVLGHKKQN